MSWKPQSQYTVLTIGPGARCFAARQETIKERQKRKREKNKQKRQERRELQRKTITYDAQHCSGCGLLPHARPGCKCRCHK